MHDHVIYPGSIYKNIQEQETEKFVKMKLLVLGLALFLVPTSNSLGKFSNLSIVYHQCIDRFLEKTALATILCGFDLIFRVEPTWVFLSCFSRVGRDKVYPRQIMDRFNPDYPLYKYACFVTSKINDSDICAYQTWLGFFGLFTSMTLFCFSLVGAEYIMLVYCHHKA